MARSLSIARSAKLSAIALMFVSLIAEAAPQAWRTDCVGLMLVDLPGDATVAGVSYRDFLENVSTPSQTIPYKFPDEEAAPWVRILYKGEVAISNPLDASMMESIIKGFLNAKDSAKVRIAGSSAVAGEDGLSFAEISGLPLGSFAWTDGNTVKTLVSLGDRMIIARVSSGRGLEASISMARDLAAKTSLRQIFDVPERSGVCVPGAFLTMGNPEIRNVGSMYRMKAYPDIKIFLRDANAATFPNPVRERNAAPLQKIRSFWAEYGMMQAVKRLTPLSGVFEKRTIAIAGREGKSSTVEIERPDGTVDYGFYASIRGVPGDLRAPDVELLVISDGKRAKQEGTTPVNKANFEKIAQRIAKSVRMRE